MRVLVVRVGDQQDWCVWTHHHAILDGWSLVLVLKEVAAYYDAALQGRPLVLPPAPPYADYITWLHQQDTAPAETFWRERLSASDRYTVASFATGAYSRACR